MKVFVVGNIAMDQTLAVDRMPIEGESIFGSKISSDLGGKGTNQAIVLARCGIPTILIAAIGTDAQSQQMREKGIFRAQVATGSGQYASFFCAPPE